MKVKVCGTRDRANIAQLSRLDIDYLGFIRYRGSPRYVGDANLEELQLADIPQKKTGVYVREKQSQILQDIQRYDWDVIQLHGGEDISFAKSILKTGKEVFKVVAPRGVEGFRGLQDWDTLGKDYPGKLHLLFDTPTVNHGGSGRQFDWELLEHYRGETPFFLSGGIGASHVEAIKRVKHNKLVGIDLNSRFEIRPAMKDVRKLADFLKRLNA